MQWKDSLTGDFVILTSSKHLNDSITQLGEKWDIEVGNDSLIKEFRREDLD